MKENMSELIATMTRRAPKGSTVYCILRHTARSGMMRVIDLAVVANDASGEPCVVSTGYAAAKILGYKYDDARSGIKASGVGMDMGFALVYALATALYGDGYALKHCWL